MSELTVGQLRGLPVNSNIVTVPAGHTLYAPGHVIQVVNVENIDRSSQGLGASAFVNISGMSATITPKSVNSKIIIQARWFGELVATNVAWDSIFGITRNGTQIARQTSGIGSTTANGITSAALSYFAGDANSTAETMSLFISDFPVTTAPVTYQLTIISTLAGTLFTNRVAGWTGQATDYELGTSSMMLMEIAQ
jgi:hypothetical protein